MPPKVVIDEAVRLAHWFGGARAPGFVNGVLDGIAAHELGDSESMNILLVNWQDRENPHAGGAEIHLFEIFGRLAAQGHRVRLVCSGWTPARPRPTVDGIEVRAGRRPEQLRAVGRGAVRRAIRAERPDVLVEDINKLPLYLPMAPSVRFCAIVPHLFGTTAFSEASWPPPLRCGWRSSRCRSAYRRAGFHAISESTRDDLVGAGCRRGQRIRVIHPGVDSARFTPAIRRRGARTCRPSCTLDG